MCLRQAPIKDLTEVLQPQYYHLVQLGGMVMMAKQELRQLSAGFYGTGFPHSAVETAVEQCNKILIHFECDSGTGVNL